MRKERAEKGSRKEEQRSKERREEGEIGVGRIDDLTSVSLLQSTSQGMPHAKALSSFTHPVLTPNLSPLAIASAGIHRDSFTHCPGIS